MASGYYHFTKFYERKGTSKLAIQKVVKSLQKKFSDEHWYYLRKIHKKEHNYFLNIGGQVGDKGGGGWLKGLKPTSKCSSSGKCSSVGKCSSGGKGSVTRSQSSQTGDSEECKKKKTKPNKRQRQNIKNHREPSEKTDRTFSFNTPKSSALKVDMNCIEEERDSQASSDGEIIGPIEPFVQSLAQVEEENMNLSDSDIDFTNSA